MPTTSEPIGWSLSLWGAPWQFRVLPQAKDDNGLRARVLVFKGIYHLHIRTARSEWYIPNEDFTSLGEAQAGAEAQVARIALLGSYSL